MLAFQRQQEKVNPELSSHLGRRYLRPENERGAVWRDRGWKLRDRALHQLFFGSRPGRWPPEQASRTEGTAECAGGVDHGLSVRCPDARFLERRLERQPRERLTRQMPDPDIVFLITDIKRDTGSVG